MSALRQIGLVTAMGLRNVPHRLGSACVVVIGIAGVVGVLVSMLTLGTSLSASARAAGRQDRAIVLREGTTFESESALFVAEAQAIATAPGVARTPAGEPAATADMVTAVNLRRKLDGALSAVMVRGMSPQGTIVRPWITLKEGRLYTPGLRELVVGRVLQAEFDGLKVGEHLRLAGGDWTIVGVYETGDMWEAMLLTDATTLMSAYQRTVFSSVTVQLESPDAFKTFDGALANDSALSVNVMRESDYYSNTSEIGSAFLILSYVIGTIMGVGALFGALNTMYSAVSARGVEIATLRAIGFPASGVVISVLIEAALLAILGGALGAAISWGLLSGGTFSLGSTAGSAVATVLHVTPALVGVGFAWALIMGLLGGLPPALRAARLPIATALRTL